MMHPRRPRPPRLRIGYLSEDFRIHPVAYAVAELFEAHDRERFEVFGYSYSKDDGSEIRKRIIGSFDSFRDIWDFTARRCHQQIVDDQIDILIDLQGFHRRIKNRLYHESPRSYPSQFSGICRESNR